MNAYDYIDDYIEGSLDGDLLKEFEGILSEDAELQLVVKNYKGVKQLSSGMLEMELLEEVNAAGKAYNNVDESSGVSKQWIVLLCLIATMLVLWFVLRDQFNVPIDNNTNQTFASLYKEPIWPIKRTTSEDTIEIALSKYINEGNLSAAKSMLLDISSDKTAGRYWIAEIYAKEGIWDSVEVYLPTQEELPKSKQRIVLLQTIIKDLKHQ